MLPGAKGLQSGLQNELHICKSRLHDDVVLFAALLLSGMLEQLKVKRQQIIMEAVAWLKDPRDSRQAGALAPRTSATRRHEVAKWTVVMQSALQEAILCVIARPTRNRTKKRRVFSTPAAPCLQVFNSHSRELWSFCILQPFLPLRGSASGR